MNAITETKAAKAIEHKSIYAALVTAQANMTNALKDVANGAFKTKYADLANVKDACFPALNAVGIAVIQPTGEDETGRYVETVFYHAASDTSISCRVPLIVGKNDMQGYGSAVTYARRYGLMSLAGIAPEDDDGNAAAAAAPKQEQQQERPKAPSKNPVSRGAFTDLQKDLRFCKSSADLIRWKNDVDVKALMEKIPDDWFAEIQKEYKSMLSTLQTQEAAEAEEPNPFSEAAE